MPAEDYSGDVIYVCMNDDCSFPWRPTPGPCDRCTQELTTCVVTNGPGIPMTLIQRQARELVLKDLRRSGLDSADVRLTPSGHDFICSLEFMERIIEAAGE